MDAFFDLLLCETGIAQQDRFLRVGRNMIRQIMIPDTIQMDSMTAGIFNQHCLRDIIRETDCDMHSGMLSLKRQMIFLNQWLQTFQHQIVFAPVELSHTVYMFFKISIPDKMGQNRLIYTGYRAGVVTADQPVLFQQIGRKDHVAHAYRRRDRFGKGTDVNHPPAVHTLHGGNRFTTVAEFAVVIIFNNIAVRG